MKLIIIISLFPLILLGSNTPPKGSAIQRTFLSLSQLSHVEREVLLNAFWLKETGFFNEKTAGEINQELETLEEETVSVAKHCHSIPLELCRSILWERLRKSLDLSAMHLKIWRGRTPLSNSHLPIHLGAAESYIELVRKALSHFESIPSLEEWENHFLSFHLQPKVPETFIFRPEDLDRTLDVRMIARRSRTRDD